jgi:H+/Cl- antiporter ClcA/CBS domain-containing protein
MFLAVMIGMTTGIGIVSFHYLIEFIQGLMLETVMGWLMTKGGWTIAFIPALGGVTIGVMRHLWGDFGPNMSAMIANSNGQLKLNPWQSILKTIAAAVSLGTGASLGPEGPSVELGANFGRFLGQILQVSQDRQRLLLAAGAAAGLAAGFNAPIAGVFFAFELVLGTTFATSAVSVVVLAAVVASLVAQIGLGSQPAFALPVYEVRSPLELPLYLGLGVLASFVALAYTQLIQVSRQFFQGKLSSTQWMGKIPPSVTPAIGGLLVGFTALKFPQIMGIGYETIEAMLQAVEFSLPLLLSLLMVKLIMTSISLGSGLVGGIFAPSMFLGASLGAAYGKILATILPSLNIAAPPAYAMVGMAALLASSARAPLTAILLMFELTRDYRIVLPLMACVGLSIWLMEFLQPKSPPENNLQKLGLNMQPDDTQTMLPHLKVIDAMTTPRLILGEDMGIIDASLTLINHRCHSALVVNADQELTGIITLHDLNRSLQNLGSHDDFPEPSLGNVCTKQVLSVYADELLTDAHDRMVTRGLHQLPVVARQQPRQVIGILEEETIPLACSLAVTREILKSTNHI